MERVIPAAGAAGLSPWLEHLVATTGALAGGLAGFLIGARIGSFALALLMALNGALCAALLAASATDLISRLSRRGG